MRDDAGGLISGRWCTGELVERLRWTSSLLVPRYYMQVSAEGSWQRHYALSDRRILRVSEWKHCSGCSLHEIICFIRASQVDVKSSKFRIHMDELLMYGLRYGQGKWECWCY